MHFPKFSNPASEEKRTKVQLTSKQKLMKQATSAATQKYTESGRKRDLKVVSLAVINLPE